MKITDIVKHTKRGGFSGISLFGQVGGGQTRLMTMNIHLSNLSDDGLAFLSKAMGAKLAMKSPVVAELVIPQGSLLDHWLANAPSDGDAKKGEQEVKGGA